MRHSGNFRIKRFLYNLSQSILFNDHHLIYVSLYEESTLRKLSTLALALSTTGVTSFALAHGGHGVTPPAGIAHYLIESLHLVPALVPLAVLAIAIRVVWPRVR